MFDNLRKILSEAVIVFSTSVSQESPIVFSKGTSSYSSTLAARFDGVISNDRFMIFQVCLLKW